MIDNDLKLFGSRLSSLRESRGMSQAALAEASGVTQAMVSRYEAGKGDVGLSNIRALARALNADASYLIGEVDSAPSGTAAPDADRLELVRLALSIEPSYIPGALRYLRKGTASAAVENDKSSSG